MRPVLGQDRRAGLALEGDARGGELAPLLPDLLASIVIERRQVVVEVAVAGVGPVELHTVADAHAQPGAQVGFGGGDEQQVQRRAAHVARAGLAQPPQRVLEQRRPATRRAATSSRGPVAGVNGIAATSFG